MKKQLTTLIVCLLIGAASCNSTKDMTIPVEPTIWIVSEIHQDKRIQNGLVGYKIIPVNHGSVNAKPVWILEFSGKYHVGQRLTFEPISADNATRFRK